MQKDYALFHLHEAKAAIEQLIAEMKADPDYNIGNFMVDMQHLYWHVNSAWNGRDFDSSAGELTDTMYESFIQYPTDLEL
jgi:hypothetical protein